MYHMDDPDFLTTTYRVSLQIYHLHFGAKDHESSIGESGGGGASVGEGELI